MGRIVSAVKTVFSDKRYFAAAVLIAAVVFSVLFLIQVKTVPGNDSRFQIAIFTWKDWLVLVAIAILNSLFITIEIYSFNLKRSVAKSLNASAGLITGGVGTSSGILASVFSTATCSLCVSALFGFLGANTVVFLVNNRYYVTVAALFLLILSLYLSSSRFVGVCNKCRIDSHG